MNMEKPSTNEDEIKEEELNEAVEKFIDGNMEQTIAFLKENKKLVSEFCLKLKDRYGINDSTTPVLELSRLIERLLY